MSDDEVLSLLRMDFDRWHDGTGFDAAKLRALTPEEREIALAELRGRLNNPDWRDLEALYFLGGVEELRSLLEHPGRATRFHAARYLDRLGHPPPARHRPEGPEPSPVQERYAGEWKEDEIASARKRPALEAASFLLECLLDPSFRVADEAAKALMDLFPGDWDRNSVRHDITSRDAKLRERAIGKLTEAVREAEGRR